MTAHINELDGWCWCLEGDFVLKGIENPSLNENNENKGDKSHTFIILSAFSSMASIAELYRCLSPVHSHTQA